MKPVHTAQVSFHILQIFAQVLYFAHFSVQNMKPVHTAQVSFHILQIFAQVLYFAHFSRLNVFSKGLLV